MAFTTATGNLPLTHPELKLLLADAVEHCARQGLAQANAMPMPLEESIYYAAKSNCAVLLVSGNETLHFNKRHFEGTGYGLLMFDSEANLLRVYGDNEFLPWITGQGIRRKTSWKEKYVGPTAISLGMQTLRPNSTCGTQHYSRLLQECAIHFSPICIARSENDKSLLGGVAIIGPKHIVHPDYLIVADAIAQRIALQAIWIESLNFMAIDGFIYVDRSTGQFKILYINNGVFEALDIPYQDYTCHALEDLFDIKSNSWLWDALMERKTLFDMDTMVHVSGQSFSVNISLTHLTVVNHHIDGACLVFNSRNRINNIISGQGTNAVFTFEHIIGRNHAFIEAIGHAKAAAKYDSNIMLLGESGVGKDIIAQAIHNESARNNKPFIAINCAALPRELIASELFGYEDGAFTGGRRGGRVGKFELANHGTIFLDEIGDMPLDLQANLLRIIEEKRFMRVGGSQVIKVDVRIIAATNKDLKEKIRRNEFRSDLYFRLSTIKIRIPALRHRLDDILLLSNYFIGKVATRVGKIQPKLTAEAKAYLCSYSWPGNIRELQNLFEGVIQIYNDSCITKEQIAYYLEDANTPESSVPIAPSPTSWGASKETERERYQQALLHNNYHRSNTAEYLGISRKTLYRKLKQLGLN